MATVSPPLPESDRLERLKRICLLDYALHIAGLLLSAGLLSVIALIINYVKRDDASGTVYESHMTWMIRTFWWALLWCVVAGAVTLLSFGLLWVVFSVPGLWFLYRMIKGLIWLNDGKAMPV